jgi:hypothetical protein
VLTTILTAVITGVAVLLAGNLAWVGLSAVNLRIGTLGPWAILPMTLYLGAYWGFISGRWGDPASASSRRAAVAHRPARVAAFGDTATAGVGPRRGHLIPPDSGCVDRVRDGNRLGVRADQTIARTDSRRTGARRRRYHCDLR